eukprot:TRINITY_DN5574_c0_g1_i1.p1 TRINITY_DN5574_c0_g1~~TRINITY_DN5574_c0_g1_i1.p1  ORF type:complete len:413 (-),score=64.95 TRINITY_DN5574_c0_g1_i1:84-1283(-)
MESMSIAGIAGGYNTLVDAIIRPPRLTYDIEDLGPRRFTMGGKPCIRTDLELKNGRGQMIQMSHYEPCARPREQLPCVIYLHGNCGSRLDAVDCLHILLPYFITLVSIDFTGSGLSDGDYVSLGYYEKDDLQTVVDYLRASGKVSRIGLWGRSMGAATSLLYGVTDPSIACMVLDSPFTSLTTVAKELVESSQIKVPKMMVNIGLKMIRKTILSKAKFDINKLEPVVAAEGCFIHVLFVHGESDTFIGVHHAKELHEKYAGDKNLILVEGDHNSNRPKFFFDSVSIFFHNMLLSPDEQLELAQAKAAASLPTEPPPEDTPLSAFIAPRRSQQSLPTTTTTSGGGGGDSFDDYEYNNGNELYDPSPEELEEELLRQALLLSMQDMGVSTPTMDDTLSRQS